MLDKVAGERGSLDDVFAGGRGYQAPAPRPPGGLTEDLPPEIQAAMNQGYRDEGGTFPSPPDPPQPELNVQRVTASELMERVMEALRGVERVFVSTGEAFFMGHTLTLSEDALVIIKAILGMEVCRQLEEEQQRVLTAVQYQGLQPTGGPTEQDMPLLQSTAPTLEPPAAGRTKPVPRVRKSGTTRGPKPVRRVSGAQAGKAASTPTA